MFSRILYENNPLNAWVIFLLLLATNTFVFFFLYSGQLFSLTFSFGKSLQFTSSSIFIYLYSLFLTIISSSLINNISKFFVEHFGLLLPAFLFAIFLNLLMIDNIDINAISCIPLLIISISQLFKLYEEEKIYQYLLNLGLLTGIASFININYILLFPVFFFWIILFRKFNIREYLLPIMAILAIYFIADAFYFLLNSTDKQFLIQKIIKQNDISAHLNLSLAVIVLLVLSIVAIYRALYVKTPLKKIKHRKYYTWILFSIFYLWIVFFISQRQLIVYFIAVFVSFSTSMVLTSLSKRIYSILLFTSMLLLYLISFIVVL